MREVAERAGVSVTTVSHVINHTRPVSEQLSERVKAAMDELGYQPNQLARSLRVGATHTIGLILPDSANPFFAEIARGIEDTGFEQGYSVIICNTDNDQQKEQLYVSVLLEKQVDGMIFVSAGESTQAISALRARRKPFVVVDRMVSNVETDSVMTDNARGGELAVTHLIQLGHRRIGCISGPSALSPSADRLTGYRNALEAHGIPVEEALIVKGDFHYQGGYAAALQLLTAPAPPTAIFALNDLMAIGAIAAAKKLGKRVPEDVSVIGFDDIDLAPYMSPALTTIAQSKHQMGVVATSLLFERIHNRALPPRFRILGVSLIVRESTAPPPKNHSKMPTRN